MREKQQRTPCMEQELSPLEKIYSRLNRLNPKQVQAEFKKLKRRCLAIFRSGRLPDQDLLVEITARDKWLTENVGGWKSNLTPYTTEE